MNLCFTEAIKDFPGYLATKDGRIISIQRVNKTPQKKRLTKSAILKNVVDQKGYHRVSLVREEKYYSRQVHRLVADAFIPNPEDKPTVNHKNGIKTDNRVENLEWNTHSENHLHACRVLKRKLPKSAFKKGRKKGATPKLPSAGIL